MRKVITLIYFALLSIGIMHAQVFEYAYKGQTLNYEVVGYAHVKTLANIGVSGDVKIPSIVKFDDKNYWVIAIDKLAFANCKNLKSIEIPRSVLTIGEEAFAQCENLQEIKIPLHIQKIEKGTFKNCKNLLKVKIPKNVTSIEKAAFYGCENLKEIKMPNSVLWIQESAFQKCKKLPEFPNSNSLIKIREYAFAECENIKQIKFPFSTKYIAANAFSGCTNLQAIEFKKNIVGIGNSAFINCPNLKDIKINKRSPFYGEELPSIKKGGNALKNNCKENSFQIFSMQFMNNIEIYCAINLETPTKSNLERIKKIESLKAIYVPKSSITKYKTTEGWSEYKDIIFCLEELCKKEL